MIENPHQVLGVSQNATQDEIKKAYRQKTKLYHPDLHPDDPGAARKMGEINEAYDMLMNPEKYAARKAQQQGYRPSGGYSQQSSQTGQQGYGGGQYQYGGYGQNGTAGDFTFEDLFGFGSWQESQRVTELPNDTPFVRTIVQDINYQRYQRALQKLMQIPGAERNSRWYYLAAVANRGQGNTVQAYEQIQRAVQMEPGNMTYQRLLRQFQQQQQTYQRNAGNHNTGASDMQRMCMGICAANMCCNLCGPFSFYI
ncbi:MAG: DnaJ domain-containing protein [Peptococcaceae bacterium]|nr:DnaJ domain-containing protein [Peptococcaceae bacterium]